MIEKKEEVFDALKQMFCTHRQGVYLFDRDVFNVLIKGEET
jgi:hypothetical protein